MTINPYESPPDLPGESRETSWWTLLGVCTGYAVWTIGPAIIGLFLGAPAGAIDGTPPYLMFIGGVGGATLYWLRRRYSV
jgi:hypothetical protein